MKVLFIRHVEIEGPGVFGEVVRESGGAIHVLDALREPFPPARDWSAVVSLGGPMGVYESDRHAFIEREIDFLRDAMGRGVPVAGVCLGAQLLAASLGARVYPAGVKEIGWFPVRLTPEGLSDPLLGWPEGEANVFHWHGDTFDLPRGASLLASSERCRHQAFVHGRSYGLQFHLEVTAPMIREWLRAYRAEILLLQGEVNGESIQADSVKNAPRLGTLCRGFFRRFLENASEGKDAP